MSDKFQSILLAGLVCGVAIAFVSQIPVLGACLCCLLYIGAGVMMVWHYSSTQGLNDSPEGGDFSSGEGAGGGALAGLCAAIASFAVSFALMELGIGPDLDDVMSQLYESGQFDDEQLDVIEGFMNSSMIWIISGTFSSIVGAVLGAVGGAIGVSMFVRKK